MSILDRIAQGIHIDPVGGYLRASLQGEAIQRERDQFALAQELGQARLSGLTLQNDLIEMQLNDRVVAQEALGQFGRSSLELISGIDTPEAQHARNMLSSGLKSLGTKGGNALIAAGNKAVAAIVGPQKVAAHFSAINPASGRTEVHTRDERGNVATTGLEAPAQDQLTRLLNQRDRLLAAGVSDSPRLRDVEAGIRKLTTITGTTEFDPGADPRTGAQQGRAFQDLLNQNTTAGKSIGELMNAVALLTDNPGAAGLTGAAGEALGGVEELGRLFGLKALAEAAEKGTETLTGLSPEELSKVRSEVKALIGPMVPVVTGDTSGRYSDSDVKITKQVSGGLEALRTPQQAIGSFKAMVGVQMRGTLRSNVIQNGVPPAWAVESEQINELGNSLLNSGWTMDEVDKLLMSFQEAIRGAQRFDPRTMDKSPQ